MDLKLIAIPFLIGRSVSHSFWGLTSSAIARRISLESSDALPYFSAYFVLTQLLLLSLIYIFTRIDWRALFSQKKLKWLAKAPGRASE